MSIQDAELFLREAITTYEKVCAKNTLAALHENERLHGLLRKATKALTCCTIISLDKDESRDIMHCLDKVTNNIWRKLGSPTGKPEYMWWERQIDPNVKFVDSHGHEIPYKG